jgi:hypothetical protein
MVKRHDGATYLFAASMYQRETNATFTIADPAGPASAEVLGEDRRIKVSNGRFTDPFPGYTARIYRIR